MRVPPLLDGYALATCSAAFNDWARKVVRDSDKIAAKRFHEIHDVDAPDWSWVDRILSCYWSRSTLESAHAVVNAT